MDGCLYKDKDYRFEFGLIENKLYVYWAMLYEPCMRLQEKLNKLPLNIEMADSRLLFDDAIRSDIQIYTSTIKSPSAVQMSKSIKKTQSVDKIHYHTHV